jgi:serine protease inhibitor
VRFLRGALTIAGVLLLTGCGASAPPGDAAHIDADLVAGLTAADATAVSRSIDDLAFDLFAQLADGKQNTITSPLSMTALLAMLLAGADGDTATQIAGVLHLTDRRDARVGALLRKVADTGDVKLSVADSLWADQGRPFEKGYLTYLKHTFGATAEEDDLGSPATAKKIDDWASDHTDGLIDDVAANLGLPDPQAVLVLLNAVYFRGDWTKRFDSQLTRPAPFTLTAGGTAEVPTMQMTNGTFGLAQRDGFRMLRLPYGKDGRYGMEIMLPDEGNTLAHLLGSLDAAQWQAAVGSLTEQSVDELALPRFELRWKGVLTDPLSRLGMPAAFGAGADFRPMSPAAPWLSTVVHQTYLRVDEHGTEAAAVSGGAMVTSARAAQTVFRVDRPFAFTISDRRTGAILFLGAVADPRG